MKVKTILDIYFFNCKDCWELLDAILCNKVCQWLAAGRWFSPGTAVSSTNKTDCHDITEILLKVMLNTIILTVLFFTECLCKIFVSQKKAISKAELIRCSDPCNLDRRVLDWPLSIWTPQRFQIFDFYNIGTRQNFKNVFWTRQNKLLCQVSLATVKWILTT